MQMAFQSARWRWEFLGTAWSNKGDANPPEAKQNSSIYKGSLGLTTSFNNMLSTCCEKLQHAATGQVSMCMVVLIELDVKQILAPVYYKTKRLLVRF